MAAASGAKRKRMRESPDGEGEKKGGQGTLGAVPACGYRPIVMDRACSRSEPCASADRKVLVILNAHAGWAKQELNMRKFTMAACLAVVFAPVADAAPWSQGYGGAGREMARDM